jgi:hypothetical protein
MPYRYGSWMMVPGMGWMWQPGGWNSWVTVPRYAGTLPVNFHPLVAPTTGTVKTVAVGKGGSVSAMPPSRLLVSAGSAGMGIPRGSLENLNHLNHQVAKSGFVEVRPAPQFSTSSPRAPAGYGQPEHSTTSSPSASTSMGHSTSAGHSSTGSHH